MLDTAPANAIIGTRTGTGSAILSALFRPRGSAKKGTMGTPRVDSYRFGQIEVDGDVYGSDLILLPDRVIPDWWREQGHELRVTDLDPVLAAEPQVLVVGTGAHGAMRVPPGTRQALQALGVEVRAAATGEACDIYNSLRERRRTAGAFHLTC